MSEPESYRQYRYERPPGACEIVLVRHGESAEAKVGQPFPLADGHGDPELHPEGRAQAEKLAERLQHEDIAAIYVSTLRRTAETAAPLAARTGIEVRVEPDLREVFLGEWEGGVFRERVSELDPIAVRMFTEERWDVIPGAEPAAVFAKRVRDAVTRIADANPDSLVVAFTHGGVIGRILSEATGSRPFAFAGSDNCSVSHIVVTGDRWTVRRFNDTTHLRSSLSHAPEPLT
ncbi:MAG: 2,3-bisphosphoglycerate-dependent phosphoglycerate mutase [Actinomycetota bacterium]|jgi:probable phosphoglycerate mutase